MFKPGKPIVHSNKGHTVQHFSQGGLLAGRQSTNIEDRRNERPPWNQRALDVIDGVDGGTMPEKERMPTQRDRALTSSAGVNGKTPANGGVDDHLNTRQFKENKMDDTGLGPKSGPEVSGTYTPDNQDFKMDDDDRPRGTTPRS